MTSTLQKNPQDINAWSITLCVMLAVAAVMLPDLASAAAGSTSINDNKITDTICKIVALMQGNIARGVAAFGVIFLGFSLFLGKISWGTALALGIGLGAIFGAQQLVNLVGDSSTGTLACSADGGA